MPEQIRKQINDIIEKRKVKAAELIKKKDELKEIKTQLNILRKFPIKCDAISDPEMRETAKKMFVKAVIPGKVMYDFDQLSQRLDDAIKRFSRDSLNIATVGMARQGKSTFLQAVSGLSDTVIPAYAAGDCTGAVSIINNDPSMNPGEVKAVLTFRSKEEMVEVVKGYILNFAPDYLKSNEITFDTIEYIDLNELEGYVENGDAEAMTQLTHLRRIIDDFNGFGESVSEPVRGLCGHAPIVLTNPEEIQKYVAQNNGESEASPLREEYCSYLAVKRADIYCRFTKNVGKLVLVDTVGLGDTQLGIAESMLETVDKECDAAIVVTKPDAPKKSAYTDLYNLLRNRFKERDISKWLFYLANEQKGYNELAVDGFVNAVRESGYLVADVKKVDSANPEEVQEKFLLPMLNTLIKNSDDIDAAYMNEVNQVFQRVKASLLKILEGIDNISTDSSNPLGIEVAKRGRECYDRLTRNLSQQVSYWYEQRKKPHATLWNQVKDILADLENILPEEPELQKVIEKNGSLIGFDIWQIPLNYIRNEITDRFISIDNMIHKDVLEFKNGIVEDLYLTLKALSGQEKDRKKEKDGSQDENGEMEAESETMEDRVHWLRLLMDKMIADKPQYTQIYRAFIFLDEFQFNMRAQLIQEVRFQLGIINPMQYDYYMQPDYQFRKQEGARAILFYMHSRLAILEDNLFNSLSKLKNIPNEAFYAAAEEFYDRLTFASDLKSGKFVNMSEIWGEFFTEYSNLIWAERKAKYEEMNQLVAEYSTIRTVLMDKIQKM